jgi:hypothetical protein
MTTVTRRYNRSPVLLEEGDIDTAARTARDLRGALHLGGETGRCGRHLGTARSYE